MGKDKWEDGHGFLFRTERWHIVRIVYDQVAWNKELRKPMKKYFVTVSNGAFMSCGVSKRLWLAWLRAHWSGRKNAWRMRHGHSKS